MYVKIKDDVVEKYPYSIGNLIEDNPSTSFPEGMPEERLAEWGVFPVKQVESPSYDGITETLTEELPIKIKNEWVQSWTVSSASNEEISNRKLELNREAESNRAYAYRTESDPLFFKWQRDESTKEEWLAKVEEIKQRYPKA